MAARLPIGTSDFAQLRRDGLTYVDKTALVTEVVRSERRVLLFPRPRRFGKTLNLSMLRAWFERSDEDAAAWFAGLEVEHAGEDVRAHLQRHPVIYLTFKDVKARGWEACLASMAQVLAEEVRRLRPLWSVAPLDPEELAALGELAGARGASPVMERTLALLSRALGATTGEEVVILVDEYDTPIHAGFAAGYYDEVVGFFRNFLSAGLKDNRFLFRGVLTGILRVAKESIPTGLNNVGVHTLLSRAFSRHFGFLDDEVRWLAGLAGQADRLPELQRWYNGYRMAEGAMYNPWSVLNALANPDDGMRPYWVNTASDDILRELLAAGASPVWQWAAVFDGKRAWVRAALGAADVG